MFVGSNVYVYYNVSHSIDGGPILYSDGNYTTNLVSEAIAGDGGYLDQAMNTGKPWMMVAAPIAPHTQTGGGDDGGGQPPVPNVKFNGMFKDFYIPRTPNFNPDTVRPLVLCC